MGGLQLNPRLTAGEIPPREGARAESEGRAGREGRAMGKREGASGAGQAGTVPQHKHRRDGCVARYSSLAGRLEASGFPSAGLQGLIGFSVQGLHTLGFQLRASRLRSFNLGCMSLIRVCRQCARGGCAFYFRNRGAPTNRALASACSPTPATQTILN